LLAQAPPEAFAGALRKIIRESGKRFLETKGARIEMNPGPRVWFEARTFLPGAEYCQVERGGDFYRCEWTPAPARIRAQHSEIAASVSNALPPHWRREARGSEARFQSASRGDPEIHVAIRDGKVLLTVLLQDP
jgi:hypothetical protein